MDIETGMSSADDSGFTRQGSENSAYVSGSESLTSNEAMGTSPQVQAGVKLENPALSPIPTFPDSGAITEPDSHYAQKLALLTAELAQTKNRLLEKEAECRTQAEYLDKFLQVINTRDAELEDARTKIRELESVAGSGLKLKEEDRIEIGAAAEERKRGLGRVENLLFSIRISPPSATPSPSFPSALRILPPEEARQKLERAIVMTREGMEGEDNLQLRRDAEKCVRDMEGEIEEKFVWKGFDGEGNSHVSERKGSWKYRDDTLEAQLLEVISSRKRLEIAEWERDGSRGEGRVEDQVP